MRLSFATVAPGGSQRMLQLLVPTFVRRFFGASDRTSSPRFSSEYDRDADILLAWYGCPRPTENIEVERDLFVRVDPTSATAIGIEVIDCAARFNKAPSAINATFAEYLLQRYADRALDIFNGSLAARDRELPLFSAQR